MEFVPLLVMLALVKKSVDFVKYATNLDINAIVTQLVAWAAGIIVVMLAANSNFADTLEFGGHLLGQMNGWSQVLVGLNIASAAGLTWDTIKAIDSSNSAIVPNLLHVPAPTPTPTSTPQ